MLQIFRKHAKLNYKGTKKTGPSALVNFLILCKKPVGGHMATHRELGFRRRQDCVYHEF